jgi:hypothetical protein
VSRAGRTGALAAAALALASAASGLDWPVEQPALLGTFGASEAGAFADGIELGGAGQPVWPVADGEVVFRYRDGDYSSFPRGSGNMVALLHEGDIMSVYSHLAPSAASPEAGAGGSVRVRARPRQLTAAELEEVAGAAGDAGDLVRSSYERRGERFILRPDLPAAALAQLWAAVARSASFAPLGAVGDSGAVEGPRLTLVLLDERERRFLNPIKPDKAPLQPPLPAGRAAPVIEQVFLEREGDRTPLADGMVVSAGSAQVLVVAYDSVTHGGFARRVAPYRLTLTYSGQIVREVKLEGLMESEGRLVLAGTRSSHDDVYADRWTYRLGRVVLPEGQARLQVRVEGIGGASGTLDLRLQVVP